MNYIRKLVASAAAAAIVSAAVSMNRYNIDRLFRTHQRNKLIDELRLWYEADLNDIEQYAVAEAAIFIEEKRDHFVSLMEGKGLSQPLIEASLIGLRSSVREVVRFDLMSHATIIYGNRLYKLDRKLAQKQQDLARELMNQRKALCRRVRETGYSIDAILENTHSRYERSKK
jgi:hypothetical protein